MVEHSQDLLLHLRPLELLPNRKGLAVYNLHGIQAFGQPDHGVAKAAQVDIADVAASKPTEELEVVEAYLAPLTAEAAHGLPVGLVGLVGLVAAMAGGHALRVRTHGDRRGASKADVADPAVAGVSSCDRRTAAVVVGFFEGRRHGWDHHH